MLRFVLYPLVQASVYELRLPSRQQQSLTHASAHTRLRTQMHTHTCPAHLAILGQHKAKGCPNDCMHSASVLSNDL